MTAHGRLTIAHYLAEKEAERTAAQRAATVAEALTTLAAELVDLEQMLLRRQRRHQSLGYRFNAFMYRMGL